LITYSLNKVQWPSVIWPTVVRVIANGKT
jgi:hypothetical protein